MSEERGGTGGRHSTAELARRFDALGRFCRTAGPHVAEPPPGVDADALDRAHTLAERASARLRLCAGDEGDHTVVALAGATGVGKSSLFNALARMDLSPASHLRPTTGEAHACVWNARGADPLLDWLGVGPAHRFVRESVLDAEDEAPLRGLVLLDLPDVDSVATGNRIEADRLVGIVDLVIWVLDPQKYADQTVHEEYLRRMGALRDVTVVVFNQADRLTAADAARCRADLARLVEADGLPGVPVITTSAVTGEGLGELRVLLEKAVAGHPAVLARLEGELEDAVASVRPLVSADPVDEAEVGRTAVPELAAGFGVAVGLDAVVADAGRAYRARAVVPGRFRRAPMAGPPIAPADPAAVAQAVRRLGAQASPGLPPPWPDQARLAASLDIDRLPDELARALSAARSRPPGVAGWRVARQCWWLAAAVALGGGIWLAVAAALGPVPAVTVAGQRLWLPAVVAVAGLVALLAVTVVAGISRRVGAARYRRALAGRLREANLTVAREVVAPVRAVLRDYSSAQAALEEAAQP